MAGNVSRWGRLRGKPRNNRLAAMRSPFRGPTRRPVFEVLEERAMLSVAQDLQNLVAPYQTAINNALSKATSLPLVGHELTSLQDLNSLLQNSLSSIESTIGTVENGHFQFAIPLPSISTTFGFNLGLDAFLKVTTQGNVTAKITPVLNVGFDDQDGSISLDTDQTNLDVGFSITLPDFTATASLDGYLFTQIADQGTDFEGHLKFGFDSDGTVSPQFSGNAHILFGLTLSFADPSLNVSFNPKFFTQLQLDWGIDSTNNQLTAPVISLNNFSLDADSFMHNFLGDIVTSMQKYTKPLEPFIDMFDQPVPILSAFDSSETMGDLFTTNLSPDQKASFELMVRVIKAVNTFSLTDTGGAVIDFGDIKLTGDAEQAGAFNFDTSQLGNAINTIFNTPALHDVENVLQEVASYAGDDAEGGMTFPLLENPGQVIGGILTGQTETMFSFSTGPQHFELAPSISFGIKDLFGVSITAGIIFDADLTMGYDTAGLTKLIQDPDHNPADLLHGFYFDNSIDTTAPPIPNVPSPRKTAVYLQGFAEVSLSAGLTISGGIYANISVELASADNSPHVALDSMIENLASKSKVFNASGALYASSRIELTLSAPEGPSITLFSYQLARVNLLDYDPPPPPASTIPTVVIDVADQHTLKLDPAKMTAGSSVSVEPFEDLTVTSGGNTFVADGIRVDYPNEIDLYVERKNNVTTDYYNLIGVNGAVPDGEYIDITDPFRLFDDEGVPNPEPSQTKPGVILAGGSNVVYQYSADSDGSQATVLLAGGYGSSTLSGGTMEFGNFIPADRVAQATQEFGDTSGYDATGVALINASINADVAPDNPVGVIGSTMTASHGGLMLGGAGNNSFIAAGPGAYEMIGGPWVNTFSISPSFEGVPATYQIDGGPFGQSQLIVRVPADENVTFENSTVPDKYNPAYKALAVLANAGLSATAHGIQAVHIVGTSGAHVTIGDTSEVNIDFSISGGAHLTFGGTDLPDIFNVTTSGSFYDGKDHVTEPKYAPTPDGGFLVPAPYGIILPSRLPDPVYSITRTFGTNNVTQTIPFAVGDEDQSSIALDAGGAADTYNITLGVGAFIDISVNDSDPTTQNKLTVNVRDGYLVNNIVTLTDNAVHLDYYTDRDYEDALPQIVTGLDYYYSDYSSSVHYTPTVTFGTNDDITFASASPFIQTIVDRPIGPQKASILVDGQGYVSVIPYPDLGPEPYVFDASTQPYTIFDPSLASHSLDVQANGGMLTIDMGSMYQSLATDIDNNSGKLSLSVSHEYGLLDTLNVHQNSGTATLDTFLFGGVSSGLENIVNVLANSGTLNIQSGSDPSAGVPADPDIQVNIGAAGGLDHIVGTIDFSNAYAQPAPFDVVVDDRSGSSNSAWTIDSTQLKIGALNINGLNNNLYYSTLELNWRTGTQVSLTDAAPITVLYNGSYSFPLDWFPPSTEQSRELDDISISLANFFTPPTDPVTYSATGLPPGLSLDSSTGLITGTIPLGARQNSPYNVSYTITSGGYTFVSDVSTWIVGNSIDLEPDFSSPIEADEGTPVAFNFYASDSANRPITFSFPGLPSWLTFDPVNYDIYGTPPLGAANDSPYQLDIHATDGLSSSDLPFELDVSGVQFGPVQGLRYNQVGSSVDFSVPATTSTGHPLTFSASDLPDGVSINPNTGEITGTLASSITQPQSYQVSVSASDGLSTQSTDFSWNVVPANYTDGLSLVSPGPLTSQVGQSTYAYVPGNSPFLLTFSYTVSGLPAGFSIDGAYISGKFAPDDVTGSPYHVTVTINDGLNTASTTFDWLATPAGAITVQSPFPQTNTVGSSVIVAIGASTTSGLPLTYSATGLPTGLSINPQTGFITGTVSNLSAIPGHFNPIVTVTDGVNTASTMFQWTINYGDFPNIIRLALPDGGTMELDSLSGTEISAAVHLSPDVAPPGSIQFPFGFVTFNVQASVYEYGATPISSTTSIEMRVTGPSATANNDYQYGPTPANPTPHWYSFLYLHQTDGDSAAGSGAEFIGGGIYILILTDGGRGDDDGTKNGVISGMGGLAITSATDPYTVTNTNDSGAGSLRQAVINANGAPGLVHSITFALPSGPQTINLQSPLPAITDPVIAVADATQNVTILSSGGATDSFATVVKTGDGTLAFGDISHVGGSLQVSGGLLRLVGGGTPSFTAGTGVTVSGTGALELAGTVSALNATVNIANSSTATAGIVVTGQNQIVGGIDGTGNVQVNNGGGVTVSHITAGSLVIGDGGTFTVAASDAGGNPLVQSAPAITVATGIASASSPTVQDSEARSSTNEETPSAEASLPTRPAASLPVADNRQRPTFSGDWFSKRPVIEDPLSRASPAADDAVPSVFRKAATAVATIQAELVDVLFENRWATSSAETHPAQDSWSDAVDDEPVGALAAELNPWGVYMARRP